MPHVSPKLNETFKHQKYANTRGESGSVSEITVELHDGDPPDLEENFPRIWIDTDAGTLKFSVDGDEIETVDTV